MVSIEMLHYITVYRTIRVARTIQAIPGSPFPSPPITC
jgi:hypothetical protein